MKSILAVAIVAPLILVAGCSGDTPEADMPQPIALTEEAAGHYCQMVILEHEGPKAQMYLAGMPAPLWFSQVRDGIAYLKSPERTGEILILYVNDMGAALSWDEPGIDNWIDAESAFFVVGSDAIGGMGAPELVPYANEDEARDFAERRGGEVMRLAEIPAEAVLSPIEFSSLEESR
ncbi:MAG: copper resistance protein CopZ [Hyphomicrobiales bacterium]|nr:copper resistance protein CopZ [Hyphomicrobiales bacterium]